MAGRLVLALSLLALGTCSGVRDGADIFFESNTDEYVDHPLVFDKPLPTWIQGTLMRNGVGRYEVGNRKFMNALDGFAKVASWKFPGNGSSFFSTKLIMSDSYSQSVKTNDIAPYLMLDKVDPAFNFFEEMESFKNGPDNMNVNIFRLGNTSDKGYVVVSDYWNNYEFDPRDLSTVGSVKPAVPGAEGWETAIVLSSAHMLPEKNTENMLGFVTVASSIPQVQSHYHFVRIKSTMEREIIASIAVDRASYMHSFVVTENYAVLIAVPFFVNPIGMIKDFEPLDAFTWDADAVTNLYVINLKTGAVKTLKTENIFFLHVCNAYETDVNKLVFDVATFKNTDAMKQMGLATLRNATARQHNEKPVLKRYTLDLETEEVDILVYETSPAAPFVNKLDFPTINENFRSQKYCYIYGVAYNYDGKDFLHMAMVKKDVCTGQNDKYWFAPGKFFNEAWFLPDPQGTDEDDGVLILPILDSASKTTNITMFDAKTFQQINTAQLPTNLPFGTHGRFFNDFY